MIKLLLSLALIFCSNSLFSQADCMRPLIYSGKINIKNFDIEKINVPSTWFLNNIVKFNKLGGFKVIEPDSTSFSKKLGTNLSSVFCQSSEEIIENFLKNKKKYPIKIFKKKKNHFGKYKVLKFKIPVEKMTFKITEDDIIEIIFPEIEM